MSYYHDAVNVLNFKEPSLESLSLSFSWVIIYTIYDGNSITAIE